MKQKAIILVYGEGGHRAQMKRLYDLIKLENEHKKYKFIGICENSKSINSLDKNFSIDPLRDKHSNFITLVNIPKGIFNYFRLFYKLSKDYDVRSVISTGPGIAIPISLYFKMLGKKIIFIETWSRFITVSMTAKVMYKIATKFYIQNKSLKKHYPDAIYGGLL